MDCKTLSLQHLIAFIEDFMMTDGMVYSRTCDHVVILNLDRSLCMRDIRSYCKTCWPLFLVCAVFCLRCSLYVFGLRTLSG